MADAKKELIKYKLQRAEETLEEAQIMLQTSHLHGAANRLYYACFYAVSALLMSRDLSSSKHVGVMSLFNRHFIKTGILPVEMGKFYSRLFDNRQDSDYADIVQINLDDVEDNLESAKGFISAIKKLTASI